MQTWIQLAITSLVAAFAGWRINISFSHHIRRRAEEQLTGVQQPPVLNGYAAILRDALTQLRLKDEEIALLRQRLADAEARVLSQGRPAPKAAPRRRRATP